MNKFNTIILLVAGLLLFVSGSAQTPGDLGSISEVSELTGPRFGLTYIGDGSTSQVLNRVYEMDSLEYSEFGTGLPFPSPTTLSMDGNGKHVLQTLESQLWDW